jgi:type IV pilus assembly protein PilF
MSSSLRFCAFFILIFSFLLSACGTFNSADKKTAELELQLGTSQLQSGNYPQALTSLLRAEKLDPESAVIQNNLGLAYYVREHFTEAEAHLRNAIKLQENYSDAHNNLGRTLIELGDYSQAVAELNIAAKDLTYPTPEKPLINLGVAYFKMKKYETAMTYLGKALNIQRDNCMAHNYYGRSLYELKSYPKAAQELDHAASFCQRTMFDEPLYYSALSYYEIGQRDLAMDRLGTLMKLYPNGKYIDRAKSMLEMMRK